MQDLRYACRMLLKAPVLSALALVTLALGTGATSTIFALVSATMLAPLPGIGDPTRVVTIGRTIDGDGFDNSSYPNYVDLRDQNTVFSDVAAAAPAVVSLNAGTRAVRLAGAVVTPSYFRALGVRFARGGPFTADQDADRSPVVVISHALWAGPFGMDPGIIGRTVSINGRPFEVVGVTERPFRGAAATAHQDLWMPLSIVKSAPILPAFATGIDWFEVRRGVWIMLYARLRPETTIERARTEVQAIARRLGAHPENAQNGWRVEPGVGLDPEERREILRVAGLLLAAVGVLFLLACANVATLSLSRMAARVREMSIRLAVGASPRRVARQLLTESLVLALLGSAAGLLVAGWSTAGLTWLFTGSSRVSLALDLSPDWRVLAFTLAIAVVAGVLVGVAPALQASYTAVTAVLKESTGTAARPTRLRQALVITQLTLSTVLLVGSGLLLQSVRAFSAIEPGFDSSNLVLVTVEPAITGRYADGSRLRGFYDQILDRVRSVDGVDAVTLARIAPVTPRGYGIGARLLDKPGSATETNGLQFNTVAPDYFQVMRIPLVRGRGLTATDTAGAPPVAVINDVAARRFWPDEDPIGKLILVNGEPLPRRVVGVAANVKYRNLVERSYPLAYYPTSQPHPMPEAPVVLHVRTRRPPDAIAADIEREVQAIDPDVPVFDVKSVSRHLADSYWQQRLVGIVIGILAALAVVLGAVGIYGVMARAAAERAREIGIRMALGAAAADIGRVVVADAARVVVPGLLLGIVLARGVTRLMGSLLYGVSPGDPLTYAAAVALLAIVAALACAGPAVRSMRVDPLAAIRQP
jgi:predicted permease